MPHSENTKSFFAKVGNEVENEIVKNIALFYGCSTLRIYDEVYGKEAEHLLDYITINRPAVIATYNKLMY